jgi:hypothetical protein
MNTSQSEEKKSRPSKENLEWPNPMKTEYDCNSSFSVTDDDSQSTNAAPMSPDINFTCNLIAINLCKYVMFNLIFHASTAPVGLDFLIVEVSRSHSETPHSVGCLWTSDRPVAETFTWQHVTLLRTTIRAPDGIRTSDSSERECTGPRLIGFSMKKFRREVSI